MIYSESLLYVWESRIFVVAGQKVLTWPAPIKTLTYSSQTVFPQQKYHTCGTAFPWRKECALCVTGDGEGIGNLNVDSSRLHLYFFSLTDPSCISIIFFFLWVQLYAESYKSFQWVFESVGGPGTPETRTLFSKFMVCWNSEPLFNSFNISL